MPLGVEVADDGSPSVRDGGKSTVLLGKGVCGGEAVSCASSKLSCGAVNRDSTGNRFLRLPHLSQRPRHWSAKAPPYLRSDPRIVSSTRMVDFSTHRRLQFFNCVCNGNKGAVASLDKVDGLPQSSRLSDNCIIVSLGKDHFEELVWKYV